MPSPTATTARGGFYTPPRFKRAGTPREKDWWTQAEALVCALRLYVLFRERKYKTLFGSTLDWIDRRPDPQPDDAPLGIPRALPFEDHPCQERHVLVVELLVHGKDDGLAFQTNRFRMTVDR